MWNKLHISQKLLYLTTLGEVKCLNFAITQLSIFFTEISHADRGTINMKHIKLDSLFQNMVMLHIN